MADGLNQARAMRIAEIMNDYRNIQQRIAGVRANPAAEEYNEVGFVLLRQCEHDARVLLAQPFNADTGNGNGNQDEQQARNQLRRIIVDAAIRRFKVQKILMRMAVAQKWINGRTAVLRGGRPNATNAAALAMVTQALRQDLVSITDARVEASLRNADIQERKWVQEDPSLAVIQRLIGQ